MRDEHRKPALARFPREAAPQLWLQQRAPARCRTGRRAHQREDLHIVQIAGGCNLHKLSQIGGPLSALVLAPVARALAAALVAVHAIGWCHRDVKPENVLLGVNSHALEMLARTDPRRAAANVHVQLCDFGIASPLPREDEPRLRQLCGSPGFFAPEVRATPGRLPRART